MTATIARMLMVLAEHWLGERRREWAAAMRREFETAAGQGEGLSFAAGCLAAAGRDLLSREEGGLVAGSHGLALGVMLPMAALQIGCALFGLPYLYPGNEGLSGALLVGGAFEPLIRGTYQAAVPSLALLQLILGLAHVRIAWATLDRDWSRAARWGAFALAAGLTLIALMAVLFLDSSQAVLQTVVLVVELGTVGLAAHWHRQLALAPCLEHPG